MKARAPAAAAPCLGRALSLDAASVDDLYGLEPVFEPGCDPRQRPLDAAIEFACPHCWQVHQSQVDLTLGDQQWIEDCQHCCQSILVSAAVADDGRAVQVEAGRADG